MVSGFDRYFQIAPCFRDEDARADRSPGEFYQLDLEMSFVEQEDVFNIVEKLFVCTFKKFSKKKLLFNKFPRISYREAMLKYGTDKPDLRNPLIISDITEVFSREDVINLRRLLLLSLFLFAMKPNLLIFRKILFFILSINGGKG